MRETKFRAWDPDMKSMSPVNPLISWIYDMTVALSQHDEKHPPEGYLEKLIFMQYTGQKDKNRKEIFEGDIIYSSFISDQKAGPVKWSDIHHGYIIDYPRRPGDGQDQWQHMHGKEHCYEVIGNIYENPELLK